MEKAVRQYKLKLQGVQCIAMPTQSTILSAKLNADGEPCIYALVEINPFVATHTLFAPFPPGSGIMGQPIFLFSDEEVITEAHLLRYLDSFVYDGTPYHVFTRG